jgi:hypothetical protein
MAARGRALRVAACALEQRLNQDTSDHVGPQLPCRCGSLAQYHGRHEKTFVSVLGPLHLLRAYYHCAQCQSGFCPRDRALRLESSFVDPWGCTHDGQHGSSGELRRKPPTAARIGGKPRSSPSGLRNRGMQKASPCAMRVRSAIRRPLRARLLWIPAPIFPTLPSA